MKKVIILTFVIFLSFGLIGCTTKPKNPYEKLLEKPEITIGVKTNSKPFGYIENGINKGFDIDVANYIVKELFMVKAGIEKPIRFVGVTTQDKIMKLNSGEVDLIIATMSKNPSRAQVVDFTTPYYIAGQAIMVHKNSKIKSATDLNKQDVGVILGSTSEKTLRQFAPLAIVKGYRNYTQAFQELKEEKIKALWADDSLLYGLKLENKNFKILPARYTKEYYCVAVRKEKNNDDLIIRLNAILENMQENGELNKIRNKWIPNTFLK